MIPYFFLQQDCVEQTGSEVGEREGDRIGKGPQAGIRTRDEAMGADWRG